MTAMHSRGWGAREHFADIAIEAVQLVKEVNVADSWYADIDNIQLVKKEGKSLARYPVG